MNASSRAALGVWKISCALAGVLALGASAAGGLVYAESQETQQAMLQQLDAHSQEALQTQRTLQSQLSESRAEAERQASRAESLERSLARTQQQLEVVTERQTRSRLGVRKSPPKRRTPKLTKPCKGDANDPLNPCLPS